MKRINLLSLILITFFNLQAQNPSPFGIRFSGYVRTDVIYDTRQSSAANGLREGHFYLFPDNALYDADSIDINASPSFHMLSIQSRLRGDINGPDAFGAKTSGALEAEFFGTSEADLNGFRLRHAFVKLDWEKSSLQIGQTWHPMFPTECFPGTISFNTGAPFTPFSRNPQIRYTYRLGKMSISTTAYSQRDFTSTGPDGSSNKYMRNSGLPAVNAQVKYSFTPSNFLILGADSKVIRPELRTAANYENNNKLTSFAGFATLQIKTKPLSLSVQGAVVQNATDLVMIGGYGIAEVIDPIKGLRSFTNLTTANAWLDLYTNGQKFQAGFFAGYSKNLGSSVENIGPVFGRGTNIDYLARVAPRIQFIREKLILALEFETTIAAYGITGSYGKVTNTHLITNYRLLAAAVYKF